MELPDCGLYRTTMAHPDHPEKVPAGRLVHFHNHSHAGKPIVMLPADNTSNTWTFQTGGYLISREGWTRSLKPMKLEGFYLTSEAFQTRTGMLVAPGQMVQLGYNRNAEPLVFFPTRDAGSNSLVFPSKGMKVSDVIYDGLRPVTTRGPYQPDATVN